MRIKSLVSITALVLLLSFALTTGCGKKEEKILKMSTTTSTQASGLLDLLLPELEKDTGIRVKVIAKGTGAAIRDGIDGNVDVIFVHAKSREEKFVKEGYGTERYAIMHNDFIVIGPQEDPAAINGMKNASEVLKTIAVSGQQFISRGDDSGTHTKEQSLWSDTGLTLEEVTTTIIKKGNEKKVSYKQPKLSDKNYVSIGQGMGKTLTYADEKKAYTLTDRGTYLKYKFGRETELGLEILCEGDPNLSNPYGIIPVNPDKHPHVNYKVANEFAKWMVSDKAQKLIADYRLLGKQLFYPDALN